MTVAGARVLPLRLVLGLFMKGPLARLPGLLLKPLTLLFEKGVGSSPFLVLAGLRC
jgi:hypothetical protein